MLKKSDDLVILGVTFDSKSIYSLFPEQLVMGLVSWEGPGEYSMIECFMRDAPGVLFCPLWSIILQWYKVQNNGKARQPIYLKQLDSVVSSTSFLTGVCLSATMHIVDLRQYYVCCMIASSLQNIAVSQDLYSSLSVPMERSRWPSIRWCGTGGFQEQGKFFFWGLSCSMPFCLLLFYLFSSFCAQVGIVGLESLNWYGVNHALPALHCQPLLIIIIILIFSHYV